MVNYEGGVIMERNTRTGTEKKKCHFGLTKRLNSKLLSRKVKCLIYKTSIRPGLTRTYGS